MTPIDLNRLPLWLIIVVLLATIAILTYAVVSGRGVNLWGFRIDSIADPKIGRDTQSSSHPVVDTAAKAARKDDTFDARNHSNADYLARMVQLQTGRAVRLSDDGSETLILRDIAEKKHKTVYARDEPGEFALIEFRGFGPVEAGVGVYEEGNGRFWLPYFTVGEVGAHCAFAISMNREMSAAGVTFFYIDNINKHAAEVEIRVIKFKTDAIRLEMKKWRA